MSRPKGSKNTPKIASAEALKEAIKTTPAFAETVTNLREGFCECGHETIRHEKDGCQHACKCLKTHK